MRLGVASPSGQALPGVAMSRLFDEQVALGLELGLRASPHLHLGLLAEGAAGGTGSDFGGASAGGAGCGGWMWCDGGSVSGRIGVQLRLHLLPYHAVDPWIAYGVALSAASVESPTAAGTVQQTFTGYEYAKVSAGLDLKLGRGSAVGLFAEWTSGRYTAAESRLGGAVVSSGSLPSTSTHGWFTIGPRLRF